LTGFSRWRSLLDGQASSRQRFTKKKPNQSPITICLSPDIIDAVTAKGPGWQTAIDYALREAIKPASIGSDRRTPDRRGSVISAKSGHDIAES
jgi:BrnA antitoxin of type II toxin-antitoxin system